MCTHFILFYDFSVNRMCAKCRNNYYCCKTCDISSKSYRSIEKLIWIIHYWRSNRDRQNGTDSHGRFTVAIRLEDILPWAILPLEKGTFSISKNCVYTQITLNSTYVMLYNYWYYFFILFGFYDDNYGNNVLYSSHLATQLIVN